MRVISKNVLLSLLTIAIATSAFASGPFIAIADVETGRALVPEGSVVPAGVRFLVGRNQDERVPLVFAYAPESQFVEARQVIATARASAALPETRYFTALESATRGTFPITPLTVDWYYLYFADGSYISAFRDIQSNGVYTWYGTGSSVYSQPGAYYTATLTSDVSSTLNPDIYAASNQCTIGSSGGYCGNPSYYAVWQQPPSFTVDHYHTIFQRFGGCFTNPNSPCLRYYYGTIQISFP